MGQTGDHSSTGEVVKLGKCISAAAVAFGAFKKMKRAQQHQPKALHNPLGNRLGASELQLNQRGVL